MPKTEESSDEKAYIRVVTRTANRISTELDRMCADLPKNVAPQSAIEGVVRMLAERQR